MRRFFSKFSWVSVVVGMLFGAEAWLLARTGLARGLEDWMLDGCFFLRGERESRAKVILIGLDDLSLAELPKPLVYISPEIAEVVVYLHAKKAAAIGIDLMVPDNLSGVEALQKGGPGDATKLGQAIKDAGNVVLPEMHFYKDKRWTRPLFQWQLQAFLDHKLTNFGLVNLTNDKDHFQRRQQLFVKDEEDQPHIQFGLALIARARNVEPTWDDDGLWVGTDNIPLDAEQKMRINYVGPPGRFVPVSFRDVLKSAKTGQAPPVSFKDAIVIIGATASGFMDQHATPYANNYWRYFATETAELMSGPEIHANIIATISDRAYIVPLSWPSSLPTMLICGALLAISYEQLNHLRRTVKFLLAGFALFVVHHFAWKFLCYRAFCLGWRIDLLPMLFLGFFAYAGSFAIRWHGLRRLMKALARVESELDRKGEERVITVLFADIRGFTSFSEKHAARQAVNLLNAYFSAIVPEVEKCRGSVNQYIGDGIMVLFGAPEPDEDHAKHAVEAAVGVVRRVHELEATWKKHDFPTFRIGVGIHTGPAIVGTVGSPSRFDYTAIGDTTNTASRIESQNKKLGSEILISAATFQAVPSSDRDRLGCVPNVQAVVLDGIVVPIPVHAVAWSKDHPAQTAPLHPLADAKGPPRNQENGKPQALPSVDDGGAARKL